MVRFARRYCTCFPFRDGAGLSGWARLSFMDEAALEF